MNTFEPRALLNYDAAYSLCECFVRLVHSRNLAMLIDHAVEVANFWRAISASTAVVQSFRMSVEKRD